ncbi:phage tail family protein [Rummeliibacillus stabekisii]|uniref:phage distal tail protein n=1 Tax=Rummeliibacillus stabekisii TaxID=241244 RepID=UPI0020402590|nr:phage tail domain-containing protein [Rummeliibacillus stabekisii]MCM3316187.1 phage tail family protein [Rummeliibacillus stabekisii]
MEKVIFTNSRGESIEFGDSPFYLQSIEGLGEVSAQIQTQKSPYMDGSSFLDAILDERDIDIDFMISYPFGTYEDISKARALIAKVCNPKLGPGLLRYENDYVVRVINAVADSVPSFPDNGGRTTVLQKGQLSFVANNPYWKSLSIEEEPAFKPLFQFPFSQPFQIGLQQDKRILNNDGDAPVPLFIEFYGPALNPVIKNNTTGEFIKVNQELLEGERMVIDTSEENRAIYFIDDQGNARNVFHWIDLASDFFKLQIGENEIEYTADNDIQGAIFNLTWQKQYNAV